MLNAYIISLLYFIEKNLTQDKWKKSFSSYFLKKIFIIRFKVRHINNVYTLKLVNYILSSPQQMVNPLCTYCDRQITSKSAAVI